MIKIETPQRKMQRTEELFLQLPGELAEKLRTLPGQLLEQMTEIRLRVNQAVTICSGKKEYKLQGGSFEKLSPEELNRILNLLMHHSAYAYQEELRRGFFTLPGGHRVGISGHVITEKGRVVSVPHISSVNIRRGCAYHGISNGIVPYLSDASGTVRNTILLSPPGCGKTTVLRDLTRNISRMGKTVGVCDERSEIAGCSDGIPSFDLGPRTDVMDGCPKTIGMRMLIRSMAPEVIIADELGTAEDAAALEQAAVSGVSVIAAMHGQSFDDLLRSPLGSFVRSCRISRIVYLTADPHPGTVRDITDAANQSLLSAPAMDWRVAQ